MPERPYGQNLRDTSREEPPEARLSVALPPFAPGKEESSLLGTTSSALEQIAAGGGHCTISQSLQETFGL